VEWRDSNTRRERYGKGIYLAAKRRLGHAPVGDLAPRCIQGECKYPVAVIGGVVLVRTAACFL
jgi:hypothetical protein